MQRKQLVGAILASLYCFNVSAQSTVITSNDDAVEVEQQLEEIIVVGKQRAFANDAVSENMKAFKPTAASVLAAVDNLPGVYINEGDTLGGDDWSTSIVIRGFVVNLNEQQIGMTIDGVPNGNSNYGGGSKANRFVEQENLLTVEVSQGTADIASPSNEALGGTLNFVTDNPMAERGFRGDITLGDHNLERYFVRYDTGELLGNTTAYGSYSHTFTNRWIGEFGETERDHLSLKTVTDLDAVRLTGRLSYDDVHEDNYQRISLAQFEVNPDWDRLTGEWTGNPYQDQVYAPGWSTLRENWLGYLKAEFAVGDVDLTVTPYWHSNEGRGDWVPPYIVDVAGIDDELSRTTEALGGDAIGRIFFVDAAGNALTPNPDCTAQFTFPYGNSGPQYHPDCYQDGAIPVGSYRHTHYGKDRYGLTADFNWVADIGDNINTLRGGIWYEDYNREEFRDWHQIIDSQVGFFFENEAYWRQYDREYPVETTKLYLEDRIELDRVALTLGLKQFFVDLERVDNFQDGQVTGSVNSDSDLLFSGGINVDVTDQLQLFGGYAENFAAVKDTVLEREASTLDQIEPETAENIDLGMRYQSDTIEAQVTYYDISFDNRIVFIAPDSPDGIDFLIGTNGSFINVGGVESQGIEASITYQLSENIELYGAYTNNDSEYTETLVSQGIVAGNKVALAPEDIVVTSLTFDDGNGWRAGVSAKLVGERFGNLANTDVLPDYQVVDAYASYSWDDKYDVKLNVNNLSDERFLGSGTPGGYFIGGGRNASLTLSGRFF